MDEAEKNFQEGVFSGVMGAYEYLGYEGFELRKKITETLRYMMNWTDEQVDDALDEVQWIFVEGHAPH